MSAKNELPTSLPPEHHKMISIIARLPDAPMIAFRNDFQAEYFKQQQAIWQWLGKRLDYLQRLQMGFRLVDPLETLVLHPRIREFLIVESEQKFAFLNLINKGFDHIKEAAALCNREFPFDNPRELFSEVCRQQASSIQVMEISDINQGCTLNEYRKHLVFLNSLYRDREEPEVTNQFLAEFKTSPSWQYFSLYAIWNYRNKKPLKHYWNEYLKAFKAVIRLQHDTSERGGAKIARLKWNTGNPVISATGKPASYAPLPKP